MIIYLDESGDLGLDFTKPCTSRYLILTVLVCDDNEVSKIICKAVQKTLKNKFPKAMLELKGTNTPLATKKYFLKNIQQLIGWKIYTVISNKEKWVEHHVKNHVCTFQKTFFYDEVAKRLLSQVNFSDVPYIHLLVDRSKSKEEVKLFDERILLEVQKKISSKTLLTIKHRMSYEEPGLQAVDLFCWGLWRKYERNDIEWYEFYSDRIASELSYKF